MDADVDPQDRGGPRLHRRDALTALGALGIGGLVGARPLGLLGGMVGSAAAASCVLSPEVTEGPYWIDDRISRRDVREGRPGLPLELVLTVQNARTCKPIKGADVEIWHADAGGEYSGFAPAGDDERFLRGHQRSDARGRATFLTIFPGWYQGRTPHIHLKVHVGGDVVHTGQAFFGDAAYRRVYRQAPYRDRGEPDTGNGDDMIYRQAGGARAQMRLAARAGGRKGYRGTLSLGVAT